MCGLSGFVSFQKKDVLSTEQVLSMNRSMSHRGPDGEGYLFFGTQKTSEAKNEFAFRQSPIEGALAHRRLSIIDLSSRATQPMSLEDQSASIVFNGEIYNHKEIREELEKLGHRFFTDHSDTEVILRAYKEWGLKGSIERFRGMFAIVLIDFLQEKIFLVRDRIGVKPLYYHEKNGTLYFASEIKAILRVLKQKPEIRPQSIYDFMTFLTVPAPFTMYEGIFKLPAAQMITYSFGGEKKVEEYWNPFVSLPKNAIPNENSWPKRILSKLRQSVKYRMESDVPVGVFLSGGVDSSANAVLFSELSQKEKVKTFTVGYDGSISHRNEFPHAKKVADQIQSTHFERHVTQKELLDFLPLMVYHQDEPLADPVCIPLYFISKMAKENGVTVCQVGEGSDELFLGYSDWITKWKLQKAGNLPIPQKLKRLLYSFLEISKISTATAREFLRRNSLGLPVFWSGAEAFTEAEKLQLFSKQYRNKHLLQPPDQFIADLKAEFLQKTHTPSISNWMTYADLKLRLPELLLMRVDKMTMACGLEARVPFLDHEFVQMALTIPEKEKMFSQECKGLLKKAVEPLLPREIIYREKQGFSVPVTEWLSDVLGGLVEKTIWDFQNETKMFNEEALSHFIEIKHRGIWNIFNLALWWKNKDLTSPPNLKVV